MGWGRGGGAALVVRVLGVLRHLRCAVNDSSASGIGGHVLVSLVVSLWGQNLPLSRFISFSHSSIARGIGVNDSDHCHVGETVQR